MVEIPTHESSMARKSSTVWK